MDCCVASELAALYCRQIRMFTTPTVVDKYTDSPNGTNGEPLIIGFVRALRFAHKAAVRHGHL
jgi:hypothetical protein